MSRATKVKYKYEEAIRNLFTWISDYREDTVRNTVSFSVTNGFDAEKLFALSDLLGVRTIHSRPDYETDGGCPTCGVDITAFISITAMDVKF